MTKSIIPTEPMYAIRSNLTGIKAGAAQQMYCSICDTYYTVDFDQYLEHDQETEFRCCDTLMILGYSKQQFIPEIAHDAGKTKLYTLVHRDTDYIRVMCSETAFDIDDIINHWIDTNEGYLPFNIEDTMELLEETGKLTEGDSSIFYQPGHLQHDRVVATVREASKKRIRAYFGIKQQSDGTHKKHNRWLLIEHDLLTGEVTEYPRFTIDCLESSDAVIHIDMNK